MTNDYFFFYTKKGRECLRMNATKRNKKRMKIFKGENGENIQMSVQKREKERERER